jgi:uncharacterized membrane protein YhaH (DUF805 family)
MNNKSTPSVILMAAGGFMAISFAVDIAFQFSNNSTNYSEGKLYIVVPALLACVGLVELLIGFLTRRSRSRKYTAVLVVTAIIAALGIVLYVNGALSDFTQPLSVPGAIIGCLAPTLFLILYKKAI